MDPIKEMLREKFGNRMIRVTEETYHMLRQRRDAPKEEDQYFAAVSVPDDRRHSVRTIYLVDSNIFHIYAHLGSEYGFDLMLAVIPSKLE